MTINIPTITQNGVRINLSHDAFFFPFSFVDNILSDVSRWNATFRVRLEWYVNAMAKRTRVWCECLQARDLFLSFVFQCSNRIFIFCVSLGCRRPRLTGLALTFLVMAFFRYSKSYKGPMVGGKWELDPVV